jgi:hypothetical protein
MSEPAVLIASAKLRPGEDRAFSDWQVRHNAVIGKFPGFISSDVMPPLLETTDFQAKPEDMWGSFMRIVSDRTIGEYFFNDDRMMDYEILGFGGRDAIESEMAKVGKKAILPPLVPFNSTEWPWKTDPSKGTGPKSFDDLHKAGLL